MANGNGETSAGPRPNTWYPLRLGSSFVESSPSTKFCTLRYEFKPASIDKTQPGTLHKNKENRVSVEFHNNQPGKPKVAFEGSSEDYKETDAVLFFDGGEFKLEKLHRAFKSLKHKRVPGESNGLTGLSGACANGAGPSAEAHSPPLPKVARTQAVNRPAMPVEVEKIDISGPENNVATRPVNNKTSTAHQPSNPNPFSPYNQDQDQDQDQEHDEHLDILGDDEPGTPNPLPSSHHTNTAVGFDINVPNHNAESDDDIDLFDDMPAENDGLSAAQALRAQVNGSGTGDVQFEQGAQGQETSSSGGESSSSGSSSASGSGSGSSSSSESEGSDADGGGADSASSAGDIDIF